MTREETLSQYRIDENGRITSPGKFEREMIYLPHFYDVYLDGFADEMGGGVLSVAIDKEDRTEFPELGRKRKRVKFTVDDNGFVLER